jgi:hypothetical protein
VKHVFVDTTGLEREAVLATLYNAASPRGMGFSHYDPRPMDIVWARRVIEERGNDLRHVLHKLAPERFGIPEPRTTLVFDYVYGRPLKVRLTDPNVEVTYFDEIHAEGLAGTVIGILRDTGDPAHGDIMALHDAGLRTAAQQEWNLLGAEHREKVLASYRRGDRPPGSMDHIIAGILWPVLN